MLSFGVIEDEPGVTVEPVTTDEPVFNDEPSVTVGAGITGAKVVTAAEVVTAAPVVGASITGAEVVTVGPAVTVGEFVDLTVDTIAVASVVGCADGVALVVDIIVESVPDISDSLLSSDSDSLKTNTVSSKNGGQPISKIPSKPRLNRIPSLFAGIAWATSAIPNKICKY